MFWNAELGHCVRPECKRLPSRRNPHRCKCDRPWLQEGQGYSRGVIVTTYCQWYYCHDACYGSAEQDARIGNPVGNKLHPPPEDEDTPLDEGHTVGGFWAKCKWAELCVSDHRPGPFDRLLSNPVLRTDYRAHHAGTSYSKTTQ